LLPFRRTCGFNRIFNNRFGSRFSDRGCAELRLAVVSPFVDRRHGTERAIAELLERLARDYHCEIHLYSQRIEGLALGQSSSPSGQQGGITWHKVPTIPGPHILQFLFWLFLNGFSRRRDRATRGLLFDLVLSPGINSLDADLVLVHALFHRLRELADEDTNQSSRPALLRRFHRRAYYSLLALLERAIYSNSQLSLAAVSGRTASLLKKYFRRNEVRVIPNGVDAAYFCPARRLALRAGARARYQLQETDFLLLLIGNDWRNKGLSTILDAMAAVREIPVCLLVAGQDATAPFFLKAAKGLGLSEKCFWEMASVDSVHLYAAADAYVSPTREDAFALPPLEAMACGLPVITSINNGGSQIITEGVDSFVLNDPNDAATLAHHLKNLQQNPELRLKIGENARQTAEAYTWERNAAAVWEFLNEVASKKQA
jgi:UDP-glucose:(heptosyl)LPS alpha-1,3-glucosyltransferase